MRSRLVLGTFVALALLVLASTAAAQDDAVRLQRAYERIDEFVAQHMKESGTPGLALAVTNRQGLLYVATYGFADLKARRPVTPDTLFEIGSISKSFTAIALLQLREEGKFDPQAPLTKYLPWFEIQTKYEPLTGHHVLTHSAGILRDRPDIGFSPYVVYSLREQQTAYAPGKNFSYSNMGYEVLGCLLEHLEGKPYEEIVRRRIFAPLGMTASSPAITNEIHSRLAVGYIPFHDDRPAQSSEPLIEAPYHARRGAAGDAAATAADLAAYLRMLLNRGAAPGGRVLSEESLALLIQPAVTVGDENEKRFYGYGLFTRVVEGHQRVWHGGETNGYTAWMGGDLTDGLGVVVLLNALGGPWRVGGFAINVVRAALHNQDLPPLPAPDPPTRIEKAADYAGTYTSPEGRTLTLVAEGEQLLLVRGQEKITLERREFTSYVDENSFYVDHPDFRMFLLRFGRDKDGKVIEASYGSDWYAGERYAGPRQFSVPEAWKAYPGHYRSTFRNFRVLLRKGKLWVSRDGKQEELVELQPGLFQIGTEETSERLRFDAVVEGKALRAEFSGAGYYRVMDP